VFLFIRLDSHDLSPNAVSASQARLDAVFRLPTTFSAYPEVRLQSVETQSSVNQWRCDFRFHRFRNAKTNRLGALDLALGTTIS